MNLIKTKKTIEIINVYEYNQHIIFCEKFINNKFKVSYFEFKTKLFKEKFGTPILVKSNFFDIIKTKNPFSGTYKSFDDFEISNPKLDDVNKYQMVLFYFDGHEIFDVDFNIIPLIKTFDYCGSYYINNKYLKLKEFGTYLKTRKDIISVSNIEDIPYYNCDDDIDKTITFSILPEKDEYTKMYNMVKDNACWSCRLKDLLCGNSHDTYDFLGITPFLKKGKL
jgi:hypothetical protein